MEKDKYKPLDARDNRHWTKVSTIISAASGLLSPDLVVALTCLLRPILTRSALSGYEIASQQI